MNKINFKERIVELIDNNYTEQNIKFAIYNEYGIKLSSNDIRVKRNYELSLVPKSKSHEDIHLIKLVKDILSNNNATPLTRKEIVELIFIKNNIAINPIDVKNILWKDLKNEITYDAINWTYVLKINKVKHVEIQKVKTLNEHLKEEIDLIIRKLFGRIKFNQTQNLDVYLYKMELDFNFNKEQDHKALYNIVNSNYLFLEKLYFLIQNFSNDQMFKDELIENNEKKILASDIALFLDIFNSLFIIDENIIIIKNKLLFNQTKDELEFLYEAYEKYYLNFTNQDVGAIQDDKRKEIEYTYNIDGYSIFVIIVNIELAPLYWSKTEGLKQYIYFNKTHPKSSLFPESSFIQILIALGRTSLSFSDNSGELFFNRMKNYLDLI